MVHTYEITALTRETAESRANVLALLLSRIPQVPHTTEDLLSETKHGILLHHKWEYSLIAYGGRHDVAGVLLSYVREPEPPLYPACYFYLAGLAVDEAHEGQGIARALITRWLDQTARSELVRSGKVLGHSVQTNSAPINERIVRLYQSFGFQERGTKTYDNRVDVVLLRPLDRSNLNW